jgi:hypothetical protein
MGTRPGMRSRWDRYSGWQDEGGLSAGNERLFSGSTTGIRQGNLAIVSQVRKPESSGEF